MHFTRHWNKFLFHSFQEDKGTCIGSNASLEEEKNTMAAQVQSLKSVAFCDNEDCSSLLLTNAIKKVLQYFSVLIDFYSVDLVL